MRLSPSLEKPRDPYGSIHVNLKRETENGNPCGKDPHLHEHEVRKEHTPYSTLPERDHMQTSGVTFKLHAKYRSKQTGKHTDTQAIYINKSKCRGPGTFSLT